MFETRTTLNCNGDLLMVEKPIVMGVLNLTQDSFYDGGAYLDKKKALLRVEEMLKEGASIIDIGANSTRPGAQFVDVELEINRILPVLKAIKKSFPRTIVSIDTFRADVVSRVADMGAGIINDISAGAFDDKLWETVAKYPIPYIMMHIQNRPENMQNAPQYEDVSLEIMQYFVEKYGKLKELGIIDVILDPGFGFGKTIENNYQLLHDLHSFQVFDIPILVGISRKSMIYKVLESSPKEALHGTTALHMIALQEGAKILRTHDVQAAIDTIKVFNQFQKIG